MGFDASCVMSWFSYHVSLNLTKCVLLPKPLYNRWDLWSVSPGGAGSPPVGVPGTPVLHQLTIKASI